MLQPSIFEGVGEVFLVGADTNSPAESLDGTLLLLGETEEEMKGRE